MLAKQAVHDKLQCSVATYLRCGEVFNNQIKSMNQKNLKSVNIWQSYKQGRDCLLHSARLANTLLNTKKVHEIITFLVVTLPNIHRF